MRTWGRVLQNGALVWQLIQTDPATGLNDLVWLTTLCQALKLNLNESPFNATLGIPQQQSVMQQIYPDYYVALIQQKFAPYFALLQITRTTSPPGSTSVTYSVTVITNQGLVLNAMVQVPT